MTSRRAILLEQVSKPCLALRRRLYCRLARAGKVVLKLVLVLVVALTGSCHCLGQTPKFPKVHQFGIDGFRLMLQQRGLRATQDRIGTALDSPEESVVIILGKLATASRISHQLEGFVRGGGALLIASDMRAPRPIRKTPIGGIWAEALRPAEMLNSSQAKKLGYRELFDCPIVTRFDHVREPMLFDQVSKIVANIPGKLIFETPVEPIAWLPFRRAQPLMAVRRLGRGRLLFISDHSIFINEMLVHGDNARFTNNVAEWLTEGGERRTLVLINDGQVMPDWSFGDTPPTVPLSSLLKAVRQGSLSGLPIGDALLPVINQSVGQAQRENELNNFVHRAAYAIFRGRGIRIALIAASMLLLAGAIRWLITTRSGPRPWLSVRDWSQPLEPKWVQAIQRRQYGPYLKHLLREFFRECGATNFESAGVPRVTQPSTPSRKDARLLRELWEFAISSPTKNLTPSKFRKLMQGCRRLRELHRAGDLHLEWQPLSPG